MTNDENEELIYDNEELAEENRQLKSEVEKLKGALACAEDALCFETSKIGKEKRFAEALERIAELEKQLTVER